MSKLIPKTLITPSHYYFWGGVFSNFYACNFTFKGLTFKSSEQAFMWCKARHFGDVNISIQILEATSPKQAKDLGRKVSNFNNEEWDKVRYDYMVEVLIAKFSQNPHLKDQLLSLSGKIAVEGSPYDKIWGVGLHWESKEILDEANWRGQNLLGKALVQVTQNLLYQKTFG